MIVRESRYVIRRVAKHPGFAFLTVLMLGIGIGSNTALFSISEYVVSHPLDADHIDRLAMISEVRGSTEMNLVSMGDFRDWSQQSRSFEGLAAWNTRSVLIRGIGIPLSVRAAATSARFFETLGIRPTIGRSFSVDSEIPGHDREAVLGFSLWNDYFGHRQDILQHTIEINGNIYQIVGVAPEGLHFPSSAALWIPLALDSKALSDRASRSYSVLGRLRPKVTLAAAHAELQTIAVHSAQLFPATNEDTAVRIVPLAQSINGDLTPLYMRMMLVVGGFVLLIVCANVANIQFARSLKRQGEVAIRSALGATRLHIIQHIVIENLLISLAGCAVALPLAFIGLRLMVRAMPQRIAEMLSGWSSIHIDGRALGYSLLLAVGAGILCCITPVVTDLRVRVADRLKATGQSVSGSRKAHRLRNAFAICQIALSLMLVIGASLVAFAMREITQVAGNFSPSSRLTLRLTVPRDQFDTQQQSALHADILERLRNMPGVTSAESTTGLPYSNGAGWWWQEVTLSDQPGLTKENPAVERATVSPQYLASMKVALLQGRMLDNSDVSGRPLTVLVNSAFVNRYYSGRAVLGHKIRLGITPDAPWATVVGIVEDVVNTWPDQVSKPTVYTSFRQTNAATQLYVIRTSGDPLSLIPSIRQIVTNTNPLIVVENIETYEAYLEDSLVGLRYVSALFALDAFIALLLSALGIYGVMANLVVERRIEMGIRMAMGATRLDILWQVLRRGIWLTAVGASVGLFLVIVFVQQVGRLLHLGRPAEIGISAISLFVVALVAIVASYLPAYRASTVDPVKVLRAQ